MLAAFTSAQVSAGEVAAFHRDGFLSLPQLTTQQEVLRMRSAYDRLFEERRGWASGHFFDFAGADEPGRTASVPQILNPSRFEGALRRTLFQANAQAIARQILGRPAKLLFEHAMLKPARTGGETPWHQDEAFAAKHTHYQYITFWMPLQPVDEANGCMQFLPGSHQGPLLEHRRINGDPRVHGLEARGVDGAAAVTCPLPAGGVTVHHWRTLHRAGPNASDGPRRAYALCFGVPSRAQTLREDFAWNVGAQTARELRATSSAHALRRLVRTVRSRARAVLSRQP